MKVYKYGFSNTLEAIKDTLADALNTKNKNDKTRYISEAYGMIRAIDFLYDDDDDDENNKLENDA